MKFNRLDIQRMTYGEYKDQIVAKLDIEGKDAQTVLTITEPDSIEIMKACASVVARAGADQAASFHKEFMEAIVGEHVDTATIDACDRIH